MTLLRFAIMWCGVLVLSCVGAADPIHDEPTPEPERSICPDIAACAEACIGLPAACGWTWGKPACVCAPEECDASACYEQDPGRRVCGWSPDGDPVEACVP